MNKESFLLFFIIAILSTNIACSQQQSTAKKDLQQNKLQQTAKIEVGAQQLNNYLAQILNTRIAIIANPSSMLQSQHLVDTLLALGISVKKVMSPEHGFRGNVGAGEHIKDGKDPRTGLPIISLYGAHKKPTKEDLADIDIVLFDLQDVGTRFYTYLSTLHLCMEACAENNKKLIVLDRPNPNGYYVDGPILERKHKSFVGMDPIPIVHGMTLGEYARMLNGEKWLKNGVQCELEVIKIKNYDHSMSYDLPIKPSPNLPNNISINLYPSLCLFEGTIVSIGRGTESPFQLYGHPDFTEFDTSFIPEPIEGAAPHPKLQGKKCNGYSLKYYSNDTAKEFAKINLGWLIDAYAQSSNKEKFFNSFFYKLSGSSSLQKQIEDGQSEDEIRETWQKDIAEFIKIRDKYLLYEDFEKEK